MVAQDTILLQEIQKKNPKNRFFFAAGEIYVFKEWLYEKYYNKKRPSICKLTAFSYT
jgi:hypothetical protein